METKPCKGRSSGFRCRCERRQSSSDSLNAPRRGGSRHENAITHSVLGIPATSTSGAAYYATELARATTYAFCVAIYAISPSMRSSASDQRFPAR